MDAMIDQVRRRAYELWELNGMVAGRDVDHWMAAETEIRAKLAAPTVKTKKAKKTAAAPAPMRKVAARKAKAASTGVAASL